jgi:hypothetical protein
MRRKNLWQGGHFIRPEGHYDYSDLRPKSAATRAAIRAIRKQKQNSGLLKEQAERSGEVTIRQVTDEEKVRYGLA